MRDHDPMAYTARYHRNHAPAKQAGWATLDDAIEFLADGEDRGEHRADAVLDDSGNVVLDGHDLDARISETIRQRDAE